MPQAQITVNASVGSDDDLPLDTLVQLDNNNIGGEVSFLWEILDQPAGPADVLSSAVVQNPTFTPKKEGSYLIRLTVNQGLPDEDIDTVIAAVRQLKTRERVPAAGEQVEDNASRGWAEDMNVFLRTIDTHLSDPGIVVGTNATAGVLARGTVVRATSTTTIKSGLPGEEKVPGFTTAPATTGTSLDELLLVVERGVDGSDPVAAGALMECRFLGKLEAITLGAGAVGDSIFVSDTATLSLTPGTNIRQVGSIMAVDGADRDIWFSGNQGGNQAPVDRAYLVYGDPGPLSAALRVDGLLAGAIINNIPVTFRGGDLTTVPLVAKKFSAPATADLFQVHDEASTVLLKIDKDGNLISTVDGTFVDLTATGGVRVGFVGTAPADTIQIGDSNFSLIFDVTKPSVVWDSGGDFIRYDRSANRLGVHIGNVEELAVVVEGAIVTNGMVVGHAGTPVDDALSVGDSDFAVDFTTANQPTIFWDDIDNSSSARASTKYNRGTNTFEWRIDNAIVLSMNLGAGLTVQAGGISIITGGFDVVAGLSSFFDQVDINADDAANPALEVQNDLGGHALRVNGDPTATPARGALLITPQDAFPTVQVEGQFIVHDTTGKLSGDDGTAEARYTPQMLAQLVDSNTVLNSSAEISFNQSFTSLAFKLRVGSTIRVRAWGVLSVAPTPTLHIRGRLNGAAGTLLFDAFLPSVGFSGVWHIDATYIVRTIGVGGTMAAVGVLSTSLVTESDTDARSPAINTEGNNTFNITAQWSVASASNTITMEGYVIDIT